MNDLEKGLNELNMSYEIDGKKYKIPTTKENLKTLLTCSLAMQKELQDRIDKACSFIMSKSYGIGSEDGDWYWFEEKFNVLDLIYILKGDD